MKKIYNVAIIGCGGMGEAHIQENYYKDNIRFTYACDCDLERAAMFQRKYGVDYITSDYKECISDDNVDIVIIATRPKSHLDILRACIQYHKHVLCEKPICDTLEAGSTFLRLVKEHPEIKVLVGHILRHNKTYQRAAEMIQAGAIGKPVIFRMVQNHHTMNWERYLSMLQEVSPLLDCGVHYADIIQWFTGAKVTDIHATGVRSEKDVPVGNYNYGLVTMRMSDGSVGYYEAGYSNTLSAQNVKEFAGPKGRIRIIFAKDRQEHQEEGDLIEFYRYPEKEYEMINIRCSRKPTGEQFEYLLQMIENNLPPVPSMEEVKEAFDIMIQADTMIKQNL